MNVDTRSLRTLSICSGYGGIELGLREVVQSRVVCYVESETYVASILANLMESGTLDPAPVWSDLRTFPDKKFGGGMVDILAGGFPCQPFSVAGKHDINDPRNLWSRVRDIIAEIRPSVVFMENVTGLLQKATGYYYWETIEPELREMEYQVAEGIFSAEELGLSHQRERLFIMAHSGGEGFQGLRPPQQEEHQNGRDDVFEGFPPRPEMVDEWTRLLEVMPEIKPSICRTIDGSVRGFEPRYRAIGNGVVPAVAANAFIVLSQKIGGMWSY